MKKQKKHHPPKLAQWILKRIFPDNEFYTSLGDFEEVYQRKRENDGFFVARFWYWKQVFKSVPEHIKNQIFWSFTMLKNYFKSTYRNLFKNKIYGIVSIFSLAVTMGCVISLFSVLPLYYKLDSVHENRKDIFMVVSKIDRKGESENWGFSPAPLGPAIKKDLPGIKDIVRIDYNSGKMKYENKVFYERFCFADEGFLDMFTYPLIYGSIDVLAERNAAIITERIADKYFGETDPIGRQIMITFENGYKDSYIVKGIAKDMPLLVTFGFEILLNYDNQIQSGLIENENWKNKAKATFIMQRTKMDLSIIESRMNKYVRIQNENDTDWKVEGFFLVPFENLWLKNPANIKNSITGSAGTTGVIVFSLIGIFLIVLACINYMNVAIASASGRLKEIGMRKVFGSRKSDVIIQFLTENVFVWSVALLFGIFLAKTIFFPALCYFGELNIEKDIFITLDFWYMFPILLIFTSILSGLYPAIFISSYNPVTIFRNRKIKSSKNYFTRLLLGLQLIVTFILIMLTVVVRHNAEYQSSLDWGYNPSNLFFMSVDGQKYYSLLKNEFQKNPDIISVTGGRNHIGRSLESSTIEYHGEKYEVNKYDVGPDYIETSGLRLKEGRNFNSEMSTDITMAVIVNEEFVRFMKWDQPLGQSFKIKGSDYSVIGVIENFHHYNFMTAIDPSLFRITDDNNFNYIVLKTKNSSPAGTLEYLKSAWKKLIPDEPFEAFYQSYILDDYLRGERKISSLFGVYALVALVISSMGLYGLFSINLLKKIKEIGIRKALGAGTFHILKLLNKEYLILLSVSSIPAAILSSILVQSAIEDMHVYHINVTVFHILFTFAVILITTLITISSIVRKATRTNPADTLRYE